ncbi:hypothetical protein HDV01_006622 [Terramyces sp. JEL0728]|nr:hypothetical protein HDV01_006622 [Terramyces sp. JEL0728]
MEVYARVENQDIETQNPENSILIDKSSGSFSFRPLNINTFIDGCADTDQFTDLTEKILKQFISGYNCSLFYLDFISKENDFQSRLLNSIVSDLFRLQPKLSSISVYAHEIYHDFAKDLVTDKVNTAKELNKKILLGLDTSQGFICDSPKECFTHLKKDTDQISALFSITKLFSIELASTKEENLILTEGEFVDKKREGTLLKKYSEAKKNIDELASKLSGQTFAEQSYITEIKGLQEKHVKKLEVNLIQLEKCCSEKRKPGLELDLQISKTEEKQREILDYSKFKILASCKEDMEQIEKERSSLVYRIAELEAQLISLNVSVANGNVQIPVLSKDIPNEFLLEYVTNWGMSNNLQFSYNAFYDAAEESDYIQQVLSACKEGTGNIDVVLFDVTEIGMLKDCLVDLYAWNFDIAENIDPIKVSGGVDNFKLVALPFETFSNVLLYNSDYLSTHGYTTVPNKLTDINDMFVDIQINERAADNFKLSGFSTSFGVSETLVELAVEWAAGSNSTLVPLSNSNSIATGNFSNVLEIIVGWINSGMIDSNDFSFDEQAAIDRWVDRQTIFLHTTTKTVIDLADIPFNWGVTGMPPYFDEQKIFGNVNGKYVGVFKFAPNMNAAVKAVQFLGSQEYQSTILSDPKYERLYITPSYPFLYSDDSVCVYLNGLCSFYYSITPAIRPSAYSGSLYGNVSSIISLGLKDIFAGSTDVYTGVVGIDARLRELLHFRPLNYVPGDEAVVAKPRRKPFKYLYEQVLVLALFIGVILTIVLLYKKKLDWEKQRKEKARTPQTEAVNDTSLLLKKN